MSIFSITALCNISSAMVQHWPRRGREHEKPTVNLQGIAKLGKAHVVLHNCRCRRGSWSFSFSHVLQGVKRHRYYQRHECCEVFAGCGGFCRKGSEMVPVLLLMTMVRARAGIWMDNRRTASRCGCPTCVLPDQIREHSLSTRQTDA